MSLDVYLYKACVCPHCGGEVETQDEIFWANITHNLNDMAQEAGIYDLVWRPDEHGVNRAEDIIDYLRGGLEKLLKSPAHFRRYNPNNGWGSYEGLVDFVTKYLRACEENPKAFIKTWR